MKLIPEVRQAMRKGQCGCTTDMWSDKFQNLSYTAVTAHYVNPQWRLKNVLLILNAFPIEEAHTGENILEEVCFIEFLCLFKS